MSAGHHDDDETPSVIPLFAESGRTPTPSVPLAPLPAPRPLLGRRKPPLGRPEGALTVAEMRERMSRDVGQAATSEIERRHGELRDELAAALEGARRLALAAIVMNALALVACLALSRVLPTRVLVAALAVPGASRAWQRRPAPGRAARPGTRRGAARRAPARRLRTVTSRYGAVPAPRRAARGRARRVARRLRNQRRFMIELGETVGNYRITAKLGEGGMGAVYLAEHPVIGRKAALKVIHPRNARNTEVVARFVNEATAMPPASATSTSSR